jgi:hypothetical protein
MNYNSFRRLMKNKYALSTVVTTLIILVISVLLASVVTYFAINVVSTRVQEESLSLSAAHIWLNSGAAAGAPTYSQASLKVINTGGRDVVITKIAVRGQDNAWTSFVDGGQGADTNSQFIVYATTNSPIQTDMYFQPTMAIPATDPSDAANPVDPQRFALTGGTAIAPAGFAFNYATSDMVLKSGYTLLIYIVNPDSITINDIGLTVSITLYTAQAMYYQECNTQAYTA